MDEDWQKEREKEFKRAIDADHNGIATKEELVVRVTMTTEQEEYYTMYKTTDALKAIM